MTKIPKINNMTNVNTITEIVMPMSAQMRPVRILFRELEVNPAGLVRYSFISRFANARVITPRMVPAMEIKCHQQNRIDKTPRIRINREFGSCSGTGFC